MITVSFFGRKTKTILKTAAVIAAAAMIGNAVLFNKKNIRILGRTENTAETLLPTNNSKRWPITA